MLPSPAPASSRPAVPAILTGLFLSAVAVVFVFSFAMNMHATSGLPYWDDWQYFFGEAQGLHVPLTWKSLLAKEADYVVPVMRVVGHGLWQVVGADFLVLRLLMWVLFGVMLAVYARLLLSVAPAQRWAGAAAGLCLISTAVAEYFHYQHMALGQPLFFILFFAYLYAAASRRFLPFLVLLLLCGSFSIFASSYVLGTIGYAAALAVAAGLRQGRAAFLAAVRDPRVSVALPLGLALTGAMAYLTFAGSYVNHTGQGLVGPWTVDFWVFLFSAFATALGFPVGMPGRYFLPLGLFGFLLFTVPLWRMLRRPAADERAAAEFVLGSILAGTVIVTMITAAGRANLCGADLAALKTCGAIPRYVYPIVVGLPAAVLAAVLSLPDRFALRPAAALAVVGVLAAGYGLDPQGRPSWARWDFAPMNRMTAERDATARACLTDYLARALPAGGDGTSAAGTPDWSRPLICPEMWTSKDLAPYLRVAYDTGAPFLRPILADLDRARRASAPDASTLSALLGSALPAPDGRTLRVELPPAGGGVVGSIDRFHALNDGTPAVSGWAADATAREPASHIVVVAGGRAAAVGVTGALRPDVATALGDPGQKTALGHSGFVIPLTGIPEGEPLRIFAITRGLRAVELKGAVRQAAKPEPAEAKPAEVKPTETIPTAPPASAGSRIVPATEATAYLDGRPSAPYRLDARDHGPVLRHGDGPDGSDRYGARDPWVFRDGDAVYMHYDAAGPSGWLAALATSRDGVTFEKKGPVLALGRPGEEDSGSASYGTTYFDGRDWHMFYLGTPNVTAPPDRIPAFPYLTMKARSASPAGPWTKQPDVVPFRPRQGTYYNNTASPGAIVRHGDGYLQFFSAGSPRTIGLARTRDLNGPWTVDATPVLPPEEQVENSSLYFQEETKTWFLFTNHVGLRDGAEFTDAVWVYWTQDVERWDPANKAVVLDGRNSVWSKTVIGLPSVVRIGDRLAIYYDGLAEASEQGERFGHMRRDVGLAWLDLPIALPSGPVPAPAPRLLDSFGAVVEPPPAAGGVAALPDARCMLDRIDRSAAAGRVFSIGGWAVASAREGVAPDRILLSLRPAGPSGGKPVHIETRAEARPDVKAHLGHPGMAGEPGFVAAADLGGLSGSWLLDLVQVKGGAAYACGIDRPLTVD